MIGGIGMPELIVIFLVFIMLFGAKKLPELARGLAQAVNTFKKEAREIKQDLDVNEQVKVLTSVDMKKDTSNDFDSTAQKRDWRPKPEEGSGVEKV